MKMPQVQALEKSDSTQLSQLMEEAQVKNYLANNPQFLRDNPQLLSYLELNHQAEGATSLIERQIKVLREQNKTMQDHLLEMLQAAHGNEKLLIQINQFMLNLLATKNLAPLCQQILQQLKTEFNLQDAALLLVGEFTESAGPAKLMPSADQILSPLDCQFPDNLTICGRLEGRVKQAIFGEQTEKLESFALIPLGLHCEHGLLVLASDDGNRFEPAMGTLFVELIAKLVTHLVRRYAVS